MRESKHARRRKKENITDDEVGYRMNETDVRDVSETRILSLTEAEKALWLREGGDSVSYRHGRWWIQAWRGFYEPVHWLGRLKIEEAIRPTVACWGYRMALRDDAAATANGVIPVLLLSEVQDYTFERLPPHSRRALRKCRKKVRIVQVLEPRILMPQAYEVEVSAAARIGVPPPSDREKFLESLDSYARDPRRIFLAGFADENFAGYLSGHAVDDVACIDKVRIATEHLPTAVGTGLTFDFVQICRETANIRHIAYGLDTPEDENLNRFKIGMRFLVTNIPCRVWIAPLMKSFIRWRFPNTYYRLTGVRTPTCGSSGSRSESSRT